MNSALNFASSAAFPTNFPSKSSFHGGNQCGLLSGGGECTVRIFCSVYGNGAVSRSASSRAKSHSAVDAHKQRSSLESLFCYDKPIPEERIEKPVGLTMAEKEVVGFQRCTCCQAKGAVLCATCSGTGLYVDSILESQGIIVKVRCLGCGGTGNVMCTDCGGRGHLGC